ncbi:hypothetical protein [Schleiferilactobacillus shenzhenensis]|uniref:Uncharacterized protein n=1 Tax=Schleiferilactobacillus shenzhenensis LY-73 TaxID=1231336 RepID=U4TRZ8_9LACO|nr:hypothetical protein [Schleiferilactobacillus shenzhenensis]ERL64262.1 hypothetical protein L248_1445 [Schleiferilactobacillus shenzhenensis LY-73]
MVILLGSGFVLLGVGLLFLVWRGFRRIKRTAGTSPSFFMQMALYAGIAVGLACIFVGISAAFGRF